MTQWLCDYMTQGLDNHDWPTYQIPPNVPLGIYSGCLWLGWAVAYSLMELGILLMIVLWAIPSAIRIPHSAIGTSQSAIRNPQSAFVMCFLFLFLCLVLLQMFSLPSGIIKAISLQKLLPCTRRWALSLQLRAFTFPLFPFLQKLSFSNGWLSPVSSSFSWIGSLSIGPPWSTWFLWLWQSELPSLCTEC